MNKDGISSNAGNPSARQCTDSSGQESDVTSRSENPYASPSGLPEASDQVQSSVKGLLLEVSVALFIVLLSLLAFWLVVNI